MFPRQVLLILTATALVVWFDSLSRGHAAYFGAATLSACVLIGIVLRPVIPPGLLATTATSATHLVRRLAEPIRRRFRAISWALIVLGWLAFSIWAVAG